MNSFFLFIRIDMKNKIWVKSKNYDIVIIGEKENE